MPWNRRIRTAIASGILSACALLASFREASAASTNNLAWAAKDKSLTADLNGVPLEKVLSRLATLTHWQVFVEPGLSRPISAKFRETKTSEALHLILGDMSYALIPGPRKKLLIYRNSMDSATLAIGPDGRPKSWLANEILLTVSPQSKEDIDALAKSLGGKIVGRSEALHAYRLQFDDPETAQAARDKLASRDDMEANDNFQYQTPDVTQARNSPGAGAFPLQPNSAASSNPNQVTVALIDTPLQNLAGGMNDFVLPAVHVAGEANPDPSVPTHGTSMAETLLSSLALSSKGQDPSPVRVLPIDVYGSNPTTTTFELGEGLYAALQAKPQIINMSLDGDGDSSFVEYLLEMAKEQNVLVFASAGNEPTTAPTYPAASPNVIGVTATDWSGNIASYANRGDFVDVKAPGTSFVQYNGQTYISTGTSTATAFISGQAASLAAQGLPPNQTAQALLQNFNVNTPARK